MYITFHIRHRLMMISNTAKEIENCWVPIIDQMSINNLSLIQVREFKRGKRVTVLNTKIKIFDWEIYSHNFNTIKHNVFVRIIRIKYWWSVFPLLDTFYWMFWRHSIQHSFYQCKFKVNQICIFTRWLKIFVNY